MRISFRAVRLIWFSLCLISAAKAQDLVPRAYVVAPTRQNAVLLSYSHLNGNLEFEGAVPIADAKAIIDLPTLSYFRTLNFFGRSANFTVALPYGLGHFHGTAFDAPAFAHRSGLLASVWRFSVNLKGGPAMSPQQFVKWRQKVLLGASIKIVPPTGQYDPTVLINLGTNRWAFKPEFGYSQRWGHWVLDAYGAVWFFTKNPEFFSRNEFNPGVVVQAQNPVGAFEGHLSYDFKLRLWVSFDSNFWFGGKTSLNGVQNQLTVQRSSRVGFTGSVPLTSHQSLKMSFSRGAYIRYSGNYTNLSAAWQYTWSGWPRFHLQ